MKTPTGAFFSGCTLGFRSEIQAPPSMAVRLAHHLARKFRTRVNPDEEEWHFTAFILADDAKLFFRNLDPWPFALPFPASASDGRAVAYEAQCVVWQFTIGVQFRPEIAGDHVLVVVEIIRQLRCIVVG